MLLSISRQRLVSLKSVSSKCSFLLRPLGHYDEHAAAQAALELLLRRGFRRGCHLLLGRGPPSERDRLRHVFKARPEAFPPAILSSRHHEQVSTDRRTSGLPMKPEKILL